jgi:hypothetical protein
VIAIVAELTVDIRVVLDVLSGGVVTRVASGLWVLAGLLVDTVENQSGGM